MAGLHHRTSASDLATLTDRALPRRGDDQSLQNLPQQTKGSKVLVDELECQMRCGHLGNPRWHNLCSRCFYFHALLPALAYEAPKDFSDVQRSSPRSPKSMFNRLTRGRTSNSLPRLSSTRSSLVKEVSSFWNLLRGQQEDQADGKPVFPVPAFPDLMMVFGLLRFEN